MVWGSLRPRRGRWVEVLRTWVPDALISQAKTEGPSPWLQKYSLLCGCRAKAPRGVDGHGLPSLPVDQ